jgi:DNA adenine methylase
MEAVKTTMKTKALASWFGSDRMMAEDVGRVMGPQKWIGVPFAGGMSALRCLQAPTLVVSDLHRFVINLARVVADKGARGRLIARLKAAVFHPDELRESMEWCRANEPRGPATYEEAAYRYFVCSWMGRSAKGGTNGEFKGELPARWNGNGGDSNTRFRSAAAGLEEWGEICARCNFHVMDCFEFLEHAKAKSDKPNAKSGLYLDPPFPGAGDEYTHRFTEQQHRRLATTLATFENTRVVCRFYDHPLVREIYPESQWTWIRLKGRKQSNEEAPEVLIVNGPAVPAAQ